MYIHQFFLVVKALFSGYFLGLLISVPLGPSGIESVKRTVSKSFKDGFSVSLGAIFADVIYLFLINCGLSNILSKNRRTEALFWVISGTVLALIGNASIRNAQVPNLKLHSIADKSSLLSMPFVAGFLITFFNPMTPSLWLTLSGTVIRAWYYVNQICYYTFLFSILAGMITWFFLLNLFALKGVNVLSPSASAKTHILLVYAIFVIGLLFILFGILKLFILI